MSGGSYDYFYSRATEKMQCIASDLASMADKCHDVDSYYRDKVDIDELQAVGAYLRALSIKVEGLALALRKLEKVTHDIEWWESGDSGPGDVVDSFKRLTGAGK